jgi:hypothetical protein
MHTICVSVAVDVPVRRCLVEAVIVRLFAELTVASSLLLASVNRSNCITGGSCSPSLSQVSCGQNSVHIKLRC